MKPITHKTNSTLDALKKYFNSREDVLMSFIFGSFIKGREHEGSDIDIAIYLKPEQNMLEIEEPVFYKSEDEIWGDLERILKREVDLVILNRSPVNICDVAVREGLPIVIRDRKTFLRYMVAVSDLAVEYRDFVEDYWKRKDAYTSRP
ncbi:MAG: type VII toxin-antitoxin system MntA family adenylyltransferase antitoxin [Candidatus Brocadia sp.]